MSTRCRIGILNNDGTVTSIYCHNDGYLARVGSFLEEFYSSEEKIRKLLDLGNLSTLGVKAESCPELWEHKNPTEQDFWDGFFEGEREILYCRSYRDRGEKNQDSTESKSIKEYIKELGEEFNYLFKDGKWYSISLDYENKIEYELIA